MTKSITISLSFLLLTGVTLAQNEEDALRYSSESLSGSARYMGMAGSSSAFGGDFSAVTQNPAAMGKFIKGNFSFTPIVEQTVSSAEYNGVNFPEQSTRLKIGNISMLKSYELNSKLNGGWLSLQLGAGYNRTKSFNQEFSYFGQSDGSIIDYFIAQADGTPSQDVTATFPFGAGLAYETYAIDPYDPGDGTTAYTSSAIGAASQSRTVRTRGGMGEFNFAMSGNYKNKLLVGGSLNIATVKYNTRFTHSETFSDPGSYIEEIDYSGFLDVKGTGVNARIGVIYIPVDMIRLGLAIESPTRFSLSEQSGNDMSTTNLNTTHIIEVPPTGAFDYVVRTPYKANASLALIYKKLGTITAEAEFVDYSAAHLKSLRNAGVNYYSFFAENNQISNLYTPALNLKFGAEVRLNPMVYLRGGYANFQSAYQADKKVFDPNRVYYTGGIGFNFGALYLDLAMVLEQHKSEYYAYDPTIAGSTTSLDTQRKQYLLTFGVRF